MKEKTKKRLKRIGKIALGTVGLVCVYKIGKWAAGGYEPEPEYLKAMDSEYLKTCRILARPTRKGRYIVVSSEFTINDGIEKTIEGPKVFYKK